ncbi:phage GP46 family protein [Xenorhabdus bovienii]|uniref:phage GP46 family protein n=1 Tax=Xenorhabdus bovienii TaxID=40576 RepID=UPI003B8A64C8|nr:phage GP46 family protein [Xenorhabdus bovienii]
MSDITSWWDVTNIHADWIVGCGDLVTGDDLQTAIIISLFTDRQARSDDDFDGVDRRGWWGDNADFSASVAIFKSMASCSGEI